MLKISYRGPHLSFIKKVFLIVKKDLEKEAKRTYSFIHIFFVKISLSKQKCYSKKRFHIYELFRS